MPVEEAALGAVVGQLSRRILEKLERGKKLTTEDILVLYLDLQYREMQEMRKEMREMYRALTGRVDRAEERLAGAIAETNRRIDRVYQELSKKIDYVHMELSKKIDEANRRIDRLYELQAAGRQGSHSSR